MKISKGNSSGKSPAKKSASSAAKKGTVKKAAAKKSTASKEEKKNKPEVKKLPAKGLSKNPGITKKSKEEFDDDLKEFMQDEEDMKLRKKTRRTDLDDDDDFNIEDDFKIEDDLSESYADEDDDDDY